MMSKPLALIVITATSIIFLILLSLYIRTTFHFGRKGYSINKHLSNVDSGNREKIYQKTKLQSILKSGNFCYKFSSKISF